MAASESTITSFRIMSKNIDIALKMKFSIKDFISKCDQIRNFLRIWSHLPKKSLIENFTFYAVAHSLDQPVP